MSGCHSGSEGAAGASLAGKHALIIVQNLPVPLDRRVWLDCGTLAAGGSTVCLESVFRSPTSRPRRWDNGRLGRSAARVRHLDDEAKLRHACAACGQ